MVLSSPPGDTGLRTPGHPDRVCGKEVHNDLQRGRIPHLHQGLPRGYRPLTIPVDPQDGPRDRGPEQEEPVGSMSQREGTLAMGNARIEKSPSRRTRVLSRR